MRRITFSISLFVLFTLALTPFASAEWKQNTITNETTERVFVVYSTWRGPDSAKQIPRGYRTVGHYAINPSASRTFYAWANNSIYFRITKSGIPQKPANATTVSHWIHPTRAFTAVSATIGGNERPTYSTVNNNELVNSDGFLRYQNGSQITVNNTWVDTVETDEPPEDTRPDAGEGEAAGAGTTATETKHIVANGRRIGIFSSNYWYSDTFTFAFPGKVVRATVTDTSSHANAGSATHSGNIVTVPVRVLAKTLPTATIRLSVTATYEVTAPSQTAGNLAVSGVPSSITSGETRTITATVTSKNGTGMPGVTVEFVENDPKIAFSSTSVTTDSSGQASTTLRTGSKGDANFVVRAAGLSRSFDLTVVPDTTSSTKRINANGRRISIWSSNYWYSDTFTFAFPGKVVRATVTDTSSHANAGSATHSGNIVTVPVRVLAKTFPTATIRLSVTATYEVLASAPGAPALHSQFGPETQQLSTFWQDLSRVPEETALLPNYPNPFNPETWIPYRLAESAEVTLSIYSLNGNRVRTLALGHQPAGFYESRSRAAYWDGRNATGERVASGVYFYTLTAGDFAATSKMLILK